MEGSSKEVVEISLAKQSRKIIICTKEAMFAARNFPTQSIRKEENATIAETPSLLPPHSSASSNFESFRSPPRR